ncbi:hypothetical protein [Thermotoga caldifontis]|uniref:hypothetical protein n=1 Tax=Thermotoga caldifontis TaxID=1508419 RepID=UPI00059796F5|nr:hypothetical protein [Thermotoga caldifontis]
MRKCFTVFLLVCSVLSFSANYLFDLVEQLAGVRDFVVDFDLTAEVKQNAESRVFHTSCLLAVRNLEDFYFLVKKPDFLSNLSFMYLSRTRRLVFGTGTSQDFETIDIPTAYITQSVLSALRLLQTPLVGIRSEGDYLILTFSKLVAQQVEEPIKVRLEIRDSQLKSIEILSPSEEEKISVKINRLVLNAKTDEYFQLPR